LIFDGATHVLRQNQRIPRSAFNLSLQDLDFPGQVTLGSNRVHLDRTVKVINFTRHHPTPLENYLALRLALDADCNLLNLVPKTEGFFPLFIMQFEALLQTVYSIEKPPEPFLTYLGVSHVYQLEQSNGVSQFAWNPRTNFLPVLTIGQAPIYTNNVGGHVLSRNFKPARHVYLDVHGEKLDARHDPAARILASSFSPHRITARVQANDQTLLSIAQAWYPRWQAYLNGTNVPLHRANFAFQAIVIPPGEHQVELRYEDVPFRIGLLISVTTLGLLLCLHVAGGRRKQGAG
jgi:hypothetical protein